MSAGGAITGTVKAAEVPNTPLEGIWVCAISDSGPNDFSGSAWNCGQTGADGTYRIEPLAATQYRVWQFPEDRARLFYNQATSWADADLVTVTAGATVENINFSLPQAGIISGNIYLEDRATSFGNGVTISTETGDYPECAGPDGSYRIWVPIGQTVKVMAGAGMCDYPGADVFPTQYWNHVTDAADATPITVVPGTTSGINFSILGDDGSITGTVTATDTGAPMENIRVEIDGLPLSDCTDDTGTYTIQGVSLNTAVLVKAGGSGNDCGGPTDYLTEWWEEVPAPEPGGAYTGAATPITLTGAEPNRTGIHFTLDPAGTISGRITNANGDPLPNMAVLAHYDIPHDASLVCTNSNGDYTMTGIHPNVDVFVWSGGINCDSSPNQYVRETWDNNLGWITSQDAIVLTPAQPDRGGINFVLAQRPVAPSGLTLTVLPTAQIQLDWVDNSDDEDQFIIERTTNPVSGWTEIVTTAADITTYLDGNVVFGTRYYYRVVAYRTLDGQYSDPSNTADATMVILPPELLTPTDDFLTSDATPAFTWNAITGATLYRIQVSNNDAFTGTLVINLTRAVPNYTPTTALVNREWFWRVQARGTTAAWSAWSEVGSFTIDTVDPVKPGLKLPTSGTVTSLSQPQFEWTDTLNPAGSIDHYEIEIDNNADFSSPVEGESAVLSFTPAAPLPDALYYWQVQAVDKAGNGSGWSLAWNLRINADVTPAPLNLLPAEGELLNDATPLFSWDAVSDATQYRIQVDETASLTAPLTINMTRTVPNFTPVTALANGVWWWRVQALGTDGAWGAWSSPQSFSIDTVKPVKPVGLTLNGTEFDVREITVGWTDNPDPAVVEYQVQIDNSTAFSIPLVADAAVLDPPFVFASPLLTDGVYYWRVQAVDAAGNTSGWTAIMNVRIDADATPVPGLTEPADLASKNDATPTFKWADLSADGVTSYQLQVSGDSTDFNPLRINVTRSVPFFTPTTVLPNGISYWKVRALGGDGAWSDWSAFFTLTIDTVKPVKITLTAPDNGVEELTDQPEFTWSASTDAGFAHYEFQIDDSSVFGSPAIELLNLTADSYIPPTGALADAKYYWRVQVVDLAGNKSGWTLARTLTIDADPTPTPTPLSPIGGARTNDTTPKLTWGAISPAALQYQVKIANNAECLTPKFNALRTATDFTPATALTAGTWYWCVRAQSADSKWGAYSAGESFVIDLTKPGVPTLLSPINNAAAPAYPVFTWTGPADPDVHHYEVQVDTNTSFLAPFTVYKGDIARYVLCL